MKIFKIISSIFLVFFLTACNKTVSVDEFFKKVSEDKNFEKEVLIEDFKLKCVYIPSELICLSELTKGQNDFKFNQIRFDQELKNYQQGCYFNLSVGMKNGENAMIKGVTSQDEYAARLGDLTYLFSENCYLISDEKDTIKALNCNFSNTYGNSPEIKVLLVFPKKRVLESKRTIEIVYADKTFGIPEKAVFRYELSEINKELPKITEQK